MAAKTRTDLVSRAAQRIGVLAAGQPLSAEDAAVIDAQIEPMLADLNARNVVAVVDPDDIDTAFFLPLADILGYWVAADFGVGLQELIGLGVDGTLNGSCETRLRKVQATLPGRAPVKNDYF